jgi:hypothetical protein
VSTHFTIAILLGAASVAVAALAASPSTKTLVVIAPVTIPRETAEKTIVVDVGNARTELLAAARSSQHDLTLELDVEAESPPQVFYEVYLCGQDGKRCGVGNVALFGAGIRSEARGEFHPAHVQLVVSECVATVLHSPSARTLKITFVAKGAEGVPPARAASALKIDKAEIVAGPRLRE